MKYILKKPITHGKITTTELTVRDHLTAGDYLAFDEMGSVAQTIALIAGVCGVDGELIKQLSGQDYQALRKIVTEMLEADRVTDDNGEAVSDIVKKPPE